MVKMEGNNIQYIWCENIAKEQVEILFNHA